MDIPDIQPDYNGPGSKALESIASWTMGGVMYALIIAAAVIVVLILVGVISERNKAKGWIAFGTCLLGAALVRFGPELLEWSQNHLHIV